MDKLAKLVEDIGKLWANYSGAYFTGIQNTLILAVAATLAGCLIGLLCGVLNKNIPNAVAISAPGCSSPPSGRMTAK